MNSKEKYHQAKKLFLELINLPKSLRDNKVKEISNTEVRQEVSELIENHVQEFTINVDQTKEIVPEQLEELKNKKHFIPFKWINRKYQLLITLGFLSLIVFSIGIFSHFYIKKTILKQKERELINISISNKLSLNNWINDREKFINLIGNAKTVRKGLNRAISYFSINNSPSQNINDSINLKLASLLEAEEIKFYHLTNKVGTVLLTNKPNYLGTTLTAKQLPQLLSIYEKDFIKFLPPTRYDIGLDTTLKKPTTWISAPIKNDDNVVAILSFGYLADEGLSNILQSQKIGQYGESIGFDRNGIQISHSRNNSSKTLHCLNRVLRSPVLNQNYDLSPLAPPVAQALLPNSETIGTTLIPYINSDYKEVIGGYIWLEQYKFGVLTEIPTTEAFFLLQQVHLIFYIIITILFLLLLSNAYILVVNYKNQRKSDDILYIGSYKVIKKIAEGGIGTVYLTEHELLKRPTAVKTIKEGFITPQNTERFEREVLLTCKLSHPNTIKIYDYGKTKNGKYYFAMELLKGITLDQLIDSAGKLPTDRAINILLQVCYSLREAHHYGLIHRDIKPQNIMICYVGDMYDFVKVLDFGLVKDLQSSQEEEITKMFEIGGTPMYMSPERLTAPSKVDFRTDIYAIGVIAYFLLTGEKPFLIGITDLDLINSIINDNPKQIKTKDIPRKLSDVIMKCLSKEQEGRPDSLNELIDALEQFEHTSWSQKLAKEWWKTHLNNVLDIKD